ncbi:hypothetical protein J5W77_03460 [Akkermansia muciniphila]|jgi:hypothetical protein|uniref:hypothetical protein n=1 Tax=Akkermansia muciniphila TaxID=239935 RepID=UPI001C05F9A6|nr:hypothetical protein [Akkermansia muciniphila]QWP06124.1 hypothetical protein J5W77_03460 [Akkermansia muciniphila]
MIQKKSVLIGTDFGTTFLVQMIPMSLENAWRIGMITNGGRNRRKEEIWKRFSKSLGEDAAMSQQPSCPLPD